MSNQPIDPARLFALAPSWGVPLSRTGYYMAQIDRAFFGHS